MSFYHSIKYLYPEAKLGEDFTLADHGEGQVLEYWNREKLGSKPSKETLDEAYKVAKLDAAIEKKCTAIDAEINKTLADGLMYLGSRIQTDEKSLVAINLFATRAYLSKMGMYEWPGFFTWIDADNNQISLSPDQFLEMATEISNQINTLRKEARQRKNAVRAMTNVEDVINA